MRYEVSETYYDMVSALVAIALQEKNPLEFELAVDLIRDLVIIGEKEVC